MQGLQAPAAFPGYLPIPSLALLPSDRLGFNHRLSPFPSGCLGSFQQLRNKSREPTFPFGKEGQPHLQPLRNDFISDVRPRRPSGSWRSTKEILTSFPPFSPNPSSWLPTKDFRKFPFISCGFWKAPSQCRQHEQQMTRRNTPCQDPPFVHTSPARHGNGLPVLCSCQSLNCACISFSYLADTPRATPSNGALSADAF